MASRLYPKLALIFFLIAIFFLFLFPIGGDGDFYHHLNTGKYVVTHLRLPQVDEYTYTANGKPWVGYAWGAGAIFYLLYSNFGPVGINILVSLIAVLTFYLLFLWLRSYKLSYFSILSSLSLASPVMAIRWPPRPEIFTYPFLISLFLIDQWRIKRPKLVWFYPLIILSWANIYGSSVLIGLGILGLLILKQLAIDKFRLKSAQKLFYALTLAAFPLSLLNGYDFRTVLYIFYIPQISHYQTEWGGILRVLNGPVDYLLFAQYQVLMYIIYLGFFILAAVFAFKKFRENLFLLVPAFALLMPIFIFRELPVGIILSLPLLAVLLSSLKNNFQKKAFLFLTVITVLVLVYYSLWLDKRGVGENDDPYSPDLIKFIEQNNISGKSFNNQQIGAFLTYNLYPKVLVYSDTRDDLFIGSNVFEDFGQVFYRKQNVVPLLGKLKVDFVVGDLEDGKSYQPLFYAEDWAIVYLTSKYFIAIPKAQAEAKKLPIYKSIDPFTFSGAKQGQEQMALAEYQNNERGEMDSWTNKLRLVLINLGLGQADKAIYILSALKPSSGPKYPLFSADVNYLLTQAYFAKKDCANSKKYLNLTDQDTKHKFIFQPNKEIPSLKNKGYTFYYLVCEKDLSKDQQSLEKYLSQPDMTDGFFVAFIN